MVPALVIDTQSEWAAVFLPHHTVVHRSEEILSIYLGSRMPATFIFLKGMVLTVIYCSDYEFSGIFCFLLTDDLLLNN